MPGDCVLADDQLRGDLAVALSGGDQAQDLELARSESMRFDRRGSAGDSVDPGHVGRCLEVREHAASRLELERSRVVVSQLAAGESDYDPRTRGLVRRLELLP